MSSPANHYSSSVDIYSQRQSSPTLTTAYLCFKVILLAANLIFMVFAFVLIGVGSWALNSKSNDLAGQTLPSGLIVIGVFMLLLSGLGAMSAWKESVGGLAAYLTLMIIVSIILFSIGVAVSVQQNEAGTYIERAWVAAPDDVKRSVQLEFDCCGLKAWNESAVQPCPSTASDPVTSVGCYDALVSGFEYAYRHAGGTAVAFSVLQVAGMVLVCCLIRGIKRKRFEADLAQLSGTQMHPAMTDPTHFDET